MSRAGKINSGITFALAFVITIVLHEFVHAVVALWFGAEPILYHVMTLNRIPLTSGRDRSHGWTGVQMLIGASEFFGYLLVTPLFPEGDFGVAAAALGIGMT